MYEKVIDKILSQYANIKKQEMGEWFNGVFDEKEIKSPIERVFYSALQILIEINCVQAKDIIWDGAPHIMGLHVEPQVEFEKYRVDFFCTYKGHPDEPVKSVIVECDSQKWHERDESERSYEKERDRFLQKQGYTVFRFTGKQLLKDPIHCAAEVVEFLTERKNVRSDFND